MGFDKESHAGEPEGTGRDASRRTSRESDTEGGEAAPGEGNSLQDASEEAVRAIEEREGSGHAGVGDIG